MKFQRNYRKKGNVSTQRNKKHNLKSFNIPEIETSDGKHSFIINFWMIVTTSHMTGKSRQKSHL